MLNEFQSNSFTMCCCSSYEGSDPSCNGNLMADGAIEADRHYLGSPQLSKDGSKLAALEGASWKII